MKRTNGGSARFGGCHCCGKHVDSTYHLYSQAVYMRPDGSEGLTHLNGISIFGHYDCLAKVTESDRASDLQTGS